MTATKIVQTEEECSALGKKFSGEANGHGLSAEFKCEKRPDYFRRDDRDGSGVVRSQPAHPVRTKVTTSAERGAIIAAIRAKMIDPASLRVSNITMYPPIKGEKGACATINAKNRFGGYTGSQNIVIYHDNGVWHAGSASSSLTCEDMYEAFRYHVTGE